MATKFIGSPINFLNASNIGLALVSNNRPLVESKIPEYKLGSNHFISIKHVYRDENGDFYMEINPEEHFKFNYIIMYTETLDPIGFMDINEMIDTKSLKMETLKIVFDFTLINKEYYIEFNLINYSNHKEEIAKVHKQLFLPKMRSNQALTKLKLHRATPNKSPFTNSLLALIRNPDLVYRYSGNLSKGLKKMISNEWIIDEGDLGSLVNFFDIDNRKVLISQYLDKLTFYDNQNHPGSINLGFEPILISNNFIVNKDPTEKLNLYSTKDILDGKGVQESFIRTLMGSDRIVIDPVEKDIMIYSFFRQQGAVPKSEKLKKIYSDLGIKLIPNSKNELLSSLDYELMYATNGLLVWYDTDEDETNLLTFYKEKPFKIQGKIKEVVVLTKDLLVYQKVGDTNKNTYLYEITQNIQTNEFKGTSYILGSNGKYRRLDKLSKNRIRDVQQVNLLNISDQGCLWVSEKLKKYKHKLTRL